MYEITDLPFPKLELISIVPRLQQPQPSQKAIEWHKPDVLTNKEKQSWAFFVEVLKKSSQQHPFVQNLTENPTKQHIIDVAVDGSLFTVFLNELFGINLYYQLQTQYPNSQVNWKKCQEALKLRYNFQPQFTIKPFECSTFLALIGEISNEEMTKSQQNRIVKFNADELKKTSDAIDDEQDSNIPISFILQELNLDQFEASSWTNLTNFSILLKKVGHIKKIRHWRDLQDFCAVEYGQILEEQSAKEQIKAITTIIKRSKLALQFDQRLHDQISRQLFLLDILQQKPYNFTEAPPMAALSTFFKQGTLVNDVIQALERLSYIENGAKLSCEEQLKALVLRVPVSASSKQIAVFFERLFSKVGYRAFDRSKHCGRKFDLKGVHGIDIYCNATVELDPIDWEWLTTDF